MKNYFQELNKAFESRTRLGIMSSLLASDGMDFNALKETLDLPDGNLAAHARALEQAGYLRVEKAFVGRKPNTRFYITPGGRLAFEQHLEVLEKIIRGLE